MKKSRKLEINPSTGLPPHAKYSGRVCFTLVWYTNRRVAEKAGQLSRSAGNRYNGGWFDGKPCGREEQFDYVDKKLGRLYAVSL